MGGRHWSAEEEDYFWTTIIPRSPQRQGVHRNNPEVGWEELAAEMNRVFDGPARRRMYTAQGIYEHWFLRARKSNYSKESRSYVEAYQAQMEKDGVPRTGLGFVQKQRPRDRRRTQKKARLRSRNTIVPLATIADEDEDEDDEEAADDIVPNNSGNVGNASAQHPSRLGAVAGAEMDEDALFVGDGTLVESSDDIMTTNPSVSHPHPNTASSTGTNIGNARRHLSQADLAFGNARHLSRADLATTNQLAPSTHAGNATSTTAIPPSRYGTRTSHGLQTTRLNSGSAGRTVGHSRHQSMAPADNAWGYQHASSTEPSHNLQETFNHVSRAPQHLSTNATGAIGDHRAAKAITMPSMLEGGNSSGTSQPTASFNVPGMVSASRVAYTGARRDDRQSRDGQRSNVHRGNGQQDYGYGQRDHGQRDHGQRDHGQRDHGQRDSGQRDHGQRDHGQHDSGQHDHGHRDHGHRDHGHRDHGQYGYHDNGHRDNGQHGYGQQGYVQHDYGQRDNGQQGYVQHDYGQRDNGQLYVSVENSLGFDIRNPLGGLVTGPSNDTYYGAYGSGSDAYSMQENTIIAGHNASFTGFSEQPMYPPSGSHNHHDAFLGTAANISTATYHPAAGNASYNWQASAAFGFSGTGENSVGENSAGENSAGENSAVFSVTSEQTSAVILTHARDSETGAWGTGHPPFRDAPFRDDNIQD